MTFLIGLLAGASLQAATISYSIANPALGTNDISNFIGVGRDSLNVSDGGAYNDGGANDAFTYIAFDRGAIGQVFTTGTNPAGYQVKAVWLRHVGYSTNSDTTYYMVPAGSHFQIRVTDPAQAGNAGFAIATETAVTTGTELNTMPTGFSSSANGTGIWLRFQLATPVHLNANTSYGFDVSSPGSFGGFGTQPFMETLGTSNNVYVGGAAYTSGPNGSGGDNTMATNVGDRVFAVEMVGQSVPPTIAALANQMVEKGNAATFTAVASGTLPLSYQWYFNTNTLLSGQTNPTLSFASADTNLVGKYSVIVTNDGGSRTSSIARLSVILPAATTNFAFSAGGSGIQDANGTGTTFSTRLAGTGASLPASDPNLLIDTSAGTLDITLLC